MEKEPKRFTITNHSSVREQIEKGIYPTEEEWDKIEDARTLNQTIGMVTIFVIGIVIGYFIRLGTE